MKLLTRTTIIYLLVTVILFAAGGVYFYSELTDLVREEAEEHLELEEKRLKEYAKLNDTIPVIELTLGDKLIIHPCASLPVRTLKDTIVFDKDADEKIPYLQLTTGLETGGEKYTIIIRKALLESDDLTDGIADILIPMVSALIIILLFVNWLVSKSAWKPFFATLSRISAFKLSERKTIELSVTRTKEFRQMNEAIISMTGKIAADYANLKSFTENASHEIQTPLAIIKARVENLMQSPNLSSDEAEQLQEIFKTTLRLSKLNQTLLLMAKIENDQFSNDEMIDLSKVLNEKLDLYEDMIQHKQLKCEIRTDISVSVKIHSVLADILVSNLLQNAIRHGKPGGALGVYLSDESLIVCNAGEPLQGDASKLFQRFYKEDTRSESTGLGLALVYEIVSRCGWTIKHTYTGGIHCFTVLFSRK